MLRVVSIDRHSSRIYTTLGNMSARSLDEILQETHIPKGYAYVICIRDHVDELTVCDRVERGTDGG